MTIQRIGFQSIPVHDQDRAIAFYTEHLGFRVHTDAPFGENWRWIFLELPGAETRLHFAEAKDIQINDKPALALVSDDVDADCARMARAGVRVTNQPQDAPWAPGVRWATIRDSEDNIVFIESFKGA